MSASDKKKLRKEQTAAALTERQRAEQKTQKKQKIYTLTFLVVMVLVVAIVLCSTLIAPVKRVLMNNTLAATVGSHEIKSTELNYFFVDSISQVYNQFSDFGDYQSMYVQMYTGWNPAKPLNEQTYDKEKGTTYADYFAEVAIESAKWNYTMYDKAQAEGFELTEDDQKAIDNTKTYMQFYAAIGGYSDVDAYVRAIYGASATLDSYIEYYTICQTATAYASKYVEDLDFTDKDFREYEADKMNEYNSYSWYSYMVDPDNYLEGGTTTEGEDGKTTTTYSDEEKQAAIDAAKVDAENLAGQEIKGLDAFNKAIQLFKQTPDSAKATEYTSQLYANAEYYTPNEEALEWLTSDEREEGDMICIEYTTKDSDDKETVEGYYVLYYVDSTTNETNVGSVMHLLVAFETDDDGNQVEGADEKAKTEAEKLLKEYNEGEKTLESFTELVKKNTDDVDSSGNPNNDGLYENITTDSNYVQEFKDWATADHEEGDVEIVKTDYGYHIMYYVEKNELNYRDMMINSDLENEAYTEWEEAILKDVKAEAVNLKYINEEFVMG